MQNQPYILNVCCKKDSNEKIFFKLQQICYNLPQYKQYQEDIDYELQIVGQRKISGLFLFLWELKLHNMAFVAVYAVLKFPFISYCLGLSRIQPQSYNFANQIRERYENAILNDIFIITPDLNLDFIKTQPQIAHIHIEHQNNDFEKALISIFMLEHPRLVDFESLFYCLCNTKIDVRRIAAEFLNASCNDVLSLCRKLQENFIIATEGEVVNYKNMPDSLKYIFEPTNEKYLYLEQLIDLYAHIFGCSFTNAYKMVVRFNHSSCDEGEILWKEYEQQISNSEYFDVAKQLKANQHKNLRSSQNYTLFYAILFHICLMETHIRTTSKQLNI